MDLMSTAQLLGNFGEFVGSIAILVTLIYLATQLRQTTKALRASSYDSYKGMADSLMGTQIEYPIPFTKVQRGEDLSPEEQTMVSAWAYQVFVQMESTYLQHREGLIDTDVYQARTRGFTEMMNNSSYAAYMRATWKVVSKYAFIDAFVRVMNEEINQPS